MKVAARRLVFALLVLCTGCAIAPSGDTALAARLVGKWSQAKYLGEARIEDATELGADGTLRVNGVFHDATGSRKYSANGVWRVEDGHFVQTIHHSDFPGWRPGLPEFRHRIITISEWEWVMVGNEGGAELRLWRFPK